MQVVLSVLLGVPRPASTMGYSVAGKEVVEEVPAAPALRRHEDVFPGQVVSGVIREARGAVGHVEGRVHAGGALGILAQHVGIPHPGELLHLALPLVLLGLDGRLHGSPQVLLDLMVVVPDGVRQLVKEPHRLGEGVVLVLLAFPNDATQAPG